MLAPSTTGAAEDAAEAIHLRFDVEAPLVARCPKEDRFVALLRSEHPPLTIAPPDVPARRFDVTVRRARDGQLRGQVMITAVDGSSQSRTVTGVDCTMLTRALAVIAAVASTAPAEKTPAASELEPEDVEPTATPPAARPDRVRRPRSSPPAPTSAVDTRGVPWTVGLGLGTELVLRALPRPAMGYRGYVETWRPLGALNLVLRGSFAFAKAQLPTLSGPNVFVQTWTGRVEGCGARRLVLPLTLEACAAATAGVFDAFTTDAGTNRGGVHNPRLWLALGVSARVRWHLVPNTYTELFANGSVPTTTFDTISRGSAATDTAVTHRVSGFVGEIGLGLGHSFGGP